jgi:hypothetical protein
MPGERCFHRPRMLFPQFRTALNIGEEKGDSSGTNVRHESTAGKYNKPGLKFVYVSDFSRLRTGGGNSIIGIIENLL